MNKIYGDFGELFGMTKTVFLEKGLDKILTMWFTYSVARSCQAV
jgi:hypothetical protein